MCTWCHQAHIHQELGGTSSTLHAAALCSQCRRRHTASSTGCLRMQGCMAQLAAPQICTPTHAVPRVAYPPDEHPATLSARYVLNLGMVYAATCTLHPQQTLQAGSFTTPDCQSPPQPNHHPLGSEVHMSGITRPQAPVLCTTGGHPSPLAPQLRTHHIHMASCFISSCCCSYRLCKLAAVSNTGQG